MAVEFFLQHCHAITVREHGCFRRVDADPRDQPIEYLERAAHNVPVAQGRRIEASRIKSAAHEALYASSQIVNLFAWLIAAFYAVCAICAAASIVVYWLSGNDALIRLGPENRHALCQNGQ